MSTKLLTLVYDEMPQDLSPDEAVFCLFSAVAADVAVRAYAAKTWAQFAEAVGLPFDELVDTTGDWGAEIAEAFGKVPRPSDPFRLADYWGMWCFAGLVIPPCQAAVLAVFDRPAINRLLTDVGFEFAGGAPGSDGDAIIFRDIGLIPRLEQEIAGRRLQRQISIRGAPRLLAKAMGLA